LKTLIVEDSETLSAVYECYLDGLGLDIAAVTTLSDALQFLQTKPTELILLDIELPDGSGLDLLPEINKLSPKPVVVVMTGHGDSYAEKAIECGAHDFLTKPFDAARLRVTVSNAADRFELSQRLSSLTEIKSSLGPMYGSSAVMQAVFTQIRSLASSKATAFITGESGTGKELAAKAIHDLSARAPAAFVPVNCAAIPADLIESELFGEAEGVRGNPARRGGLISLAEGGTLFLDEVCDMPYELQAVLLRFIQSGTYKPVGSDVEVSADVRIIAATNREPLVEMREGRLREDLYYRLHVIPLRMPPLREREDDVLMLANHFVSTFAEQEGKKIDGFSDDARREIKRFPFPGNIRQLANTIHRIILLNSDTVISYEALRKVITDSEIQIPASSVSRRKVADVGALVSSEVEPLWATEKRAIQAALDACDGNINRAAGLLEVAPSTIYRKIQGWKSGEA